MVDLSLFCELTGLSVLTKKGKDYATHIEVKRENWSFGNREAQYAV
jgi:hypothetical protein